MTSPGERVESEAEERKGDPARVAALSDGVIAIVLTIMVLELEVPDLGGGQSLADALGEIRPTLVAFIVSFLIVAMYWVAHRDLFALVRRVNRDVVWLNMLFLLVISMIPWATALLGRYDLDPAALHVYGFVLVLAAGLRTLLYWYVSARPHLLWDPISARRQRISLGLLAFPAGVYLVAMALAGAAPQVSLGLFAVLPLLYFLAVTLLRDRPGEEDAGRDFT